IKIVDGIAWCVAPIGETDRLIHPERAVSVGNTAGQLRASAACAEHDGDARALLRQIILDLLGEACCDFRREVLARARRAEAGIAGGGIVCKRLRRCAESEREDRDEGLLHCFGACASWG